MIEDWKPDDYIFQIWQARRPALKTACLEAGLDVGDENQDPRISEEIHLLKKNGFSMDFARKAVLSERQTKILATLTPNTVLACPEFLEDRINPILAVLFFADISGFTLLSEKCAATGEGGVYRLTAIINGFLGKMVGEVYEWGGDVWEFSGDAFLAIWKVNLTDNLGHMIHRALRCALAIQKTHGFYETDMKTILRVKVGISVGNIIWCMVGDKTSRRSLLVGAPVLEVKKAESFCTSGDVVVGPSAWGHISPRDCVHEILEDGGFVKVTKVVGYMGILSPSLMKAVGAPGTEDRPQFSRERLRSLHEVRQFPNLQERGDLGSDLRHTQMTAVIQQVDADLALDYLTEMRTLTVMFVNIIPRKLFAADLVKVIDKCYYVVRELVQSSGGSIDKVTAFDKDIMCLVIFGLRGFFHEARAAKYLASGYDIRDGCLAISGVKNVSVGITTGMVYSGVVGHPLRQAFTVIGPVVNKAARLMTAYPGQVTCDSTTYKSADCPAECFVKAPYRPLRGISRDEQAYEFNLSKERLLSLALEKGLTPIVGRSSEMEMFRSMLRDLDNPERFCVGILISGDKKTGKTRLFDEMIAETYNKGINALLLHVRPGLAILPYGVAIDLLYQAMKLTKDTKWKTMISKLRPLLSGKVSAKDLKGLETLFNRLELNFYDPVSVSKSMKRIFVNTLASVSGASVIGIDDADLCDAASWELLMALVEAKPKLLVILTSEPGRGDYEVTSGAADKLYLVRMEPMNVRSIAHLVCQQYHAEAICSEIVNFCKLDARPLDISIELIDEFVYSYLESKSKGNPGACKDNLRRLMDNGYVEMQEMQAHKAFSLELYYPLPGYLKARVILLPPQPILVAPNDADDMMDQTEFDYLDHLCTMRVFSSQTAVSKKADVTVGKNRRESVRFTNTEIPGLPLRLESREGASVDLEAMMREIYDFPPTAHKQSQILEQRTSTTIMCPKDSNPLDDVMEESLECFSLLKAQRNMKDEKDADMGLDQLLKYKNTVRNKRAEKVEERHRTSPAKVDDSQAANDDDVEADSVDDDEFDDLAEVEDHNLRSGRTSTVMLDRVSTRRPGWVMAMIRAPGKDLHSLSPPDVQVGLISVFDSLKPFEQLMLKSASILGKKFRRGMLEAILHCPSSSFMSMAVKRMFEMNIFRCTLAQAQTSHLTCDCDVPYSLKHSRDLSLPQYASCLNLGFRHAKFRDVLYDLMPPNQKRMFHERAAEFLVALPQRCSSCQSQITGEPHPGRANSYTPFIESHTNHTSTVTRGSKVSIGKELSDSVIPDFNSCTCPVVACGSLKELIMHSSAAGKVLEPLLFNLDLAETYIEVLALSEARTIVNQVEAKMKDSAALTYKDRQKLKARVEFVLGALCFEEGDYDSAHHHLMLVLHNSYSFIMRHSTGRSVAKKMAFLNRLSFNVVRFRGTTLDAKTMNLLTLINIINKEFKEAEFLNKLALKLLERLSDVDVRDMALALANRTDIEISTHGHLDDLDFEQRLSAFVEGLLPIRSVKAAEALARSTYCLYLVRALGFGDLLGGLDLLCAVNKLCGNAQFLRGSDLITVETFHIQMFLGQARDAVSTILPLRSGTNSQQFWFHSLALDFVRTTGCWIESPVESENFLMRVLKDDNPEKPAYKRSAIALLLWLIYVNPTKASQVQTNVDIALKPAPVRNVTDATARLDKLLCLLMQTLILTPGTALAPRMRRNLRLWLASMHTVCHQFTLTWPFYLVTSACVSAKLDGDLKGAHRLINEASKIAEHLKMEFLQVIVASLLEVLGRLDRTDQGIGITVPRITEWSHWSRADWINTMFPII